MTITPRKYAVQQGNMGENWYVIDLQTKRSMPPGPMSRPEAEQYAERLTRASEIKCQSAPSCSLCGATATLRLPVRSAFPRQPACEQCAGSERATPEDDPWGECYPYPLDAQIPLLRQSQPV